MKKINIFSLITGIIGAVNLSYVVATIIFMLCRTPSGSIGIIGAADSDILLSFAIGVFISSWQFVALLFGVALILTSLFTAIFKKTTENCLTIKTSLTAVIVSALCAVTVYCAGTVYKLIKFNAIDARPVAFPCCLVAGIIAIVGLIVLLALYISSPANSMDAPIIAGFLPKTTASGHCSQNFYGSDRRTMVGRWGGFQSRRPPMPRETASVVRPA